jgi:large subunit ribosomal protein L15
MPLHRRLPKKGFSNVRFQDKIVAINVSLLDKFFAANDTVDENALRSVGLVQGTCDAVKILGGGELTKPLTVLVDFASASAREKISAAGGTVTILSEEA